MVQSHKTKQKNYKLLALPVYLVLPAGANRSQTIDLIEENNWWPHQVSLWEKKKENKNHTQ